MTHRHRVTRIAMSEASVTLLYCPTRGRNPEPEDPT